MKRRKKLSAQSKHKRFLKRLSKGAVDVKIAFILILVLLIFLSAMLFQMSTGGKAMNSGQIPAQVTIASQEGMETGGGLRTIAGITPHMRQLDSIGPDCELMRNDVIIVFDQSGSMKGNKLVEAKAAAALFAELVAFNPQSRVGLVTFSKSAMMRSPLTNDIPALTEQINQIRSDANTCIQCGVQLANQQMSTNLRADAKRSIVLLSDGIANYVNGRSQKEPAAKAAAMTEMQKGFETASTSAYTIAFGDDADTKFMQQAADITHGLSYSALSEDELSGIFSKTASDICQNN